MRNPLAVVPASATAVVISSLALLSSTGTIGSSLAFSTPFSTTAFTALPASSSASSSLLISSATQSSPLRVRTSPYYYSLSPHSSTSTSTCLPMKRKLLSEDDLAEPPNQKVIQTIESLASDSIIASDLATKTGLSLTEAQKSLSALASLSRGDISVTNDGELLYTFPPNLQSVLRSNSLRYKLTNTWINDIWPKLFWGIRISFGVFLFVSIAAIFSTLFFIQTGGGDDREDNNDRRGGMGGGGMFRYGVGDLLFDLFYPRPYLYSSNYYGYYAQNDPYAISNTNDNANRNANDPRGQPQEGEEERSGIFEGIFSYIFGDGNPNRNLEAARLREASRTIRANGGAVTAEQLAPFCDVEDPDNIMRDDFSISDEGFVLPIVSQLGGVPTVTDDGDIVYLFEDLQVSALDTDADMDGSNDNESLFNTRGQITKMNNMECLQEMTLDFNRNENIGNIAAGALGVINLAGALYLGQLLSSPALTGVQLAGFFGAVQAGYPLLVIYAILFNVIPAARYLYNQKTNSEISQRNSARRKWLTYLQVGGEQVTRKLSAAKSLRRKMKRLVGGKDGKTAYDTRTTIEDLTSEKQALEMKKFDELLGGGGNGKGNGNAGGVDRDSDNAFQ